jgi:hypothetical protein
MLLIKTFKSLVLQQQDIIPDDLMVLKNRDLIRFSEQNSGYITTARGYNLVDQLLNATKPG